MKNDYVIRRGQRQKPFLTMINSYPKEHGIHYFLVVEGESDEKFFNKFLNHSVCRAVSICDKSSSNKEEVITFIKEKNRCGQKGFLGVVDADFDHIIGRSDLPLPNNIIMTDFHDIEMVILGSVPDLSGLYAEIADPLLVNEYEAESGSFIDSVLNVAYEIGILRLACVKRTISKRPSTKDLMFCDCINRSFFIDLDKLIKRVVSGSGGKCSFDSELKEEYESEKSHKHDKYQVCCGHDVTELLRFCFTSEDPSLGYGHTKLLNSSRIESLLRVTYSPDSFSSTDMYKKILDWQEKNKVKILNSSVFSQ